MSRLLLTFLFIALLSPLNLRAIDCTKTSTNSVALTDGVKLYPNGSNTRPDAHTQKGLALAAQILPRRADGMPDPAGRIVIVSISMSNGMLEFQSFQALARSNAALLNPSLVLVNGASSGKPAMAWVDPNSPAWVRLADRLTKARCGALPCVVTHQQVQALWIKTSHANPSRYGTPEQEAEHLRQTDRLILAVARQKFPNLKLVFGSSRIYGGYSYPSTGQPEPYAHGEGMAFRALVGDSIGGAEPSWVSWGAYIWANGIKANSNGLTWRCPQDFKVDGLHPSDVGSAKVAKTLWDNLMADPVTKGWFRR